MKKSLFFAVFVLILCLAFPCASALASPADTAQIVGGGNYLSLADAISAASEGDSILLLQDVFTDAQLTVNKTLTIDFNGWNIYSISSSYSAFYVGNGGNLTLSNSGEGGGGLIVAAGHEYEEYFEGIRVKATAGGSAAATVGEDITIEAGCPVYILGNSEEDSAQLDVYGTLIVSQYVRDTEHPDTRDAYAAVQGNGTIGLGGTLINIYDGAQLSNDFSAAMYLPQSGVVNIYGGDLSGNMGVIGIKSGTLNISGGRLSATTTAPYADPPSATNRIEVCGSAIHIDSYIGYAGNMNINISGDAEISSENGYAIHEVGNTLGETNVVTISINGGTLTGALGTIQVTAAAEDNIVIRGGSFSSDPSVYVPSGYKVSGSGPYLVSKIYPRSSNPDVEVDDDTVVSGGDEDTDVSDDELEDILESAGESGILNLDLSQAPADTTSVNIDAEAMSQIADAVTDSGNSLHTMSVTLPGGTITFDDTAVAAIAAAAGEADSITLSMEPVEHTALTAEQQALVGNALVLDLTLTVDGRPQSTFNGGSASIEINYTPPTGADPQGVTVWFLADNGDLIPCAGAYNPWTGKYFFQTQHFSKYVIGYFPFNDVSADAWYYENVIYAYSNGLLTGTAANLFSPEAKISRAMLATVLWRLEAEPAAADAGFGDLSEDWYRTAVNWAASQGIVDGYDNSRFAPQDPLTREQAIAILYRYAVYKGYDVQSSGNLLAFSDQADIADWAVTAMSWAVAQGLISGSDSQLLPQGSADRAQMAAILQRFLLLNQ